MVPDWIAPRYPLNFLLSNGTFRLTSAYKALVAQPLGFIDVGARGGVHDLMAPVAGATAVLGFEPDKEACEELNAFARSGKLPWAQLKCIPTALSDRQGDAVLHLCSAPTNHSLLPVNRAFAERYRMVKFAQTGTFPLVTEPLDDVLFGALAEEQHWGEFIKLDTQGTELDILHGASRTLDERTVALFVEVEFCEIYEKQKLFSDVELALRGKGFTFFGFHSTHERARKALDKRRYIGRERLLHADAVFFKDPLPGATAKADVSPRGRHVIFVCALLLGYFDFALELAEDTFPDNKKEMDAVRKVIEDLAYQDPASARHDAIELAAAVNRSPELANVAVGRFVDERRAVCNFEDVPVKLG
jgi:FkbM family methyltransferase